MEHIENYFRTAAFHCAVGASTSVGFAQDIGGRISVGALGGGTSSRFPFVRRRRRGGGCAFEKSLESRDATHHDLTTMSYEELRSLLQKFLRTNEEKSLTIFVHGAGCPL